MDVEALFGALERPRLTSWHLKVFHTVCLDGLHGYIVCWPTYCLQGQCWGPKMGSLMSQIGHCDPSRAPKDSLGCTHSYHALWLGIGLSTGSPGRNKATFWPKRACFSIPNFCVVYLVFVDMSESYAWRELHTAAVLHMLGGQTQIITQSHSPHWISSMLFPNDMR